MGWGLRKDLLRMLRGALRDQDGKGGESVQTEETTGEVRGRVARLENFSSSAAAHEMRQARWASIRLHGCLYVSPRSLDFILKTRSHQRVSNVEGRV